MSRVLREKEGKVAKCSKCSEQVETRVSSSVKRRRCAHRSQFSTLRAVLRGYRARITARQHGDEATLTEIEIMLAKTDLCDLTAYIEEMWEDEEYLKSLSVKFIDSVFGFYERHGIELNMSSDSDQVSIECAQVRNVIN